MKISSIAILAVGIPTVVQAGGFISSCAQIFLGGTWINALCKNKAGVYVPTAKDLNAEIGNANGLLTRHSSGYANVCRDCSLTTAGVFKCSCPRINRYQPASINLNNFLSNRDGTLFWD
ncbi:hypothetical protein TWF225_010966 [Orbilia oligospora]|nr:hypothetical protein TWF225_010966 [Orbilia oligospora]KAF3265719.1 hypothetical protein TWF217_002259 [Orbilia oligospora]KAF3271581.1 hypothetical protein TWF128_000156 [Orbilia oligospora]KAF3295075.1 hypothetical protein TWF132_002399 [Orbilia oligospora]